MGAFGGTEVAGEVRAAHDAAVSAALRFLEEHAAFSGTGRGGPFQVYTEGYVAAAFTHRTSRAGDPQLHSHVLAANKVRCVDGRWRSLDGREVFAFQKGAGMAYNATLRVELTARLGVEWEPVDGNGQADLRGVPRGLIEHFSKRRKVEIRGAQRIAVAEARLGRTLTDDERTEQYQFATYDTRPPKTGHAEDEATLGGRWRTEADGAGWEPETWLPAASWRTLERPLALSTEIEPGVVDGLVAELAEARSSWGRAEVAKAVARRLPPDLAGDAEAGRVWDRSDLGGGARPPRGRHPGRPAHLDQDGAVVVGEMTAGARAGARSTRTQLRFGRVWAGATRRLPSPSNPSVRRR